MLNSLFVRTGKEYSKLLISDIIYVEALKNYVRIVTAKNKYVIKSTMRQVEELLPTGDFCRIHRSYIISLQYISGFNYTKVHIHEKHLPVSKGYRKVFNDQVITFEREIKTKAILLKDPNGEYKKDVYLN